MLDKKILETAFSTMATAKAMTVLYEDNFKIVSKYVHATSRGHEAIQIAVAMQLLPQDYAFPYYRDDAMLLGIGMQPYDLMLQLLAKKDDPFSGGRTYYCHPSLNDIDKPKIPHQSSATGMQAIPATGAAMGLKFLSPALSEGEGAESKRNVGKIVDLKKQIYKSNLESNSGSSPFPLGRVGDGINFFVLPLHTKMHHKQQKHLESR